MKIKGQASIELILLLTVALLLIQTIILPSFDIAKKSSDDVSGITTVRSQAQKLANAIQLVDSSAEGARISLVLQIPAHSRLSCDAANTNTVLQPAASNPAVFFVIKPALEKPTGCDFDSGIVSDDYCTGKIPLRVSSNVGCNLTALQGALSSESFAFYSFDVIKAAGQITVTAGG